MKNTLFEEFVQDEMKVILSPKLEQVLNLYLRSGMTKKEMAENLEINPSTISTHLSRHLMKKYPFWGGRAEAQSDYILFLESKIRELEAKLEGGNCRENLRID